MVKTSIEVYEIFSMRWNLPSYVEKGSDLLEEASMLSQCGDFSEATGYKTLARTLKSQLHSFTGQLEEARERIEGTATCYQLLDKSYEWALDAMRYMSSMRMEHSTTVSGLDKLLASLSAYLADHPPLTQASFTRMLDSARRLQNEKLLEQCRVAEARCQETHKLLELRQTNLRRARNQMEVEKALGGDAESASPSTPSPDRMSRGGGQEINRTTPSGPVIQDTAVLAPSPLTFYDPETLNSSPQLRTDSWKGQGESRETEDGGEGVGDSSQHKANVSESTTSEWEPRETSTPTRDSTPDGSRPNSHTPSDNDHFRHPRSSSSPSQHSVPRSHSAEQKRSSPFSSPVSLSASLSSLSSQSSFPAGASSDSAYISRKPRLYQPSSSMSRLYNNSPTRMSPQSAASQGNIAGSKGPLGRTISAPLQARTVHSLPAGPSPTSRPLKKMLKRASTVPVPMLTSPILEEEPVGTMGEREDSGKDGELGSRSREQRSAKSISLITGSSESLPSMPEEDEGESELDISPDGCAVKDWTPVPVNTHLHRNSARGTPTGPMADLRLSEAEMKSKRTVSLIMSEMVQTERDYVRALQFITDHYVCELQREDVPPTLRGKRTVVFGNLEKIQQFHSHYFLPCLESCTSQPFLVGQFFLQHETMFYLYALYNKNKPKSDALMMEYGKEFFREKQFELGDKMDLSSYLLKPVQRMGKYALLLKQMLKECSETEPEYPELKAAEEMVKFQLRHGNDLLAMDSLRECDVNLQEQGRLLRQEEFLVFQGRKKSMRRIFLFEDLILFSKTRRGRQGQHDIYVYKYSFKTADIGLTENYGDSGYKFEIWFRRRSVGENYVLQAPSSEVKKAWVKDISRLLWHQAIRNRESRINELATMGIGNKPCMDIKPSQDNIQDRSISLNNRAARTRNSIAVSSFEYLRNGNKRPHSIISVSSNSSSGSSQSSLGLLGSLNLAFDPLDSPRLNRRSILSNESGIVPDGDTSFGDLGSENRGPSPRRASVAGRPTPVSSVRSYFDVMKSRVLKQKYSDQVFTDV